MKTAMGDRRSSIHIFLPHCRVAGIFEAALIAKRRVPPFKCIQQEIETIIGDSPLKNLVVLSARHEYGQQMLRNYFVQGIFSKQFADLGSTGETSNKDRTFLLADPLTKMYLLIHIQL